MEQTRKLLADAFDKDPSNSSIAYFYVDHLLASGRISPQMTVSVLSSVAANATSDNVRLDALRTMPQLLEQKNYQQRAQTPSCEEHFEPDSKRHRDRSPEEATDARHSDAC